jgi:hypothetical protein
VTVNLQRRASGLGLGRQPTQDLVQLRVALGGEARAQLARLHRGPLFSQE